MPTSERTHRLVLLLFGGGIIAFAIWGGMKAFTTRFSPIEVMPRSRVSFDPKAKTWESALFASLTAFATGDVTTGAVGKILPFGGLGGGQLLQGQVSPLAMLEEVSLGGARALDLARLKDGSALVLLYGINGDGLGSYEIRSYQTDGSATTYAVWRAGGNEPVSLRISAADDGAVWVGGSSGHIGRCERGGRPEWFMPSATGLAGSVTSMAVDGAGRVWATDGASLALGGRDAFAPFPFASRLRAEDSAALVAEALEMPEETRPTPLEGADGLLRALIAPRRLSVLSNGEMGLIAARTAFVFPLALQNSIRWTDVSAASVPLAFDGSGDVYARSIVDGAFTRVWATGTTAYTSVPLPRDARVNPDLFGSGPDGLFALDYVPTSTVLWTARGGTWTAQIVAASGTAPGDEVVRVGSDGAGNIFAILRQGGLIRIRRGSSS